MAKARKYRPQLPQPVPVRLPVEKTGLVVIDMQNDFCRPDGASFVGGMAIPTIPRIRSLLEKAREQGVRVIYTQSWHRPDDPRYSDHPRASIGAKGKIAGTWGAEIIEELEPAEGEPVVRKDSHDCWFGTDMEQVLARMGFGKFEYDSPSWNRLRHDSYVVITGTASAGCVDKAATGFYLRGYQLIIPADCISDHSEFAQDVALYTFTREFYGTLTRSDLIEFVSS